MTVYRKNGINYVAYDKLLTYFQKVWCKTPTTNSTTKTTTPSAMKMSDKGKQMLKNFELTKGYAPYLFTEEGIYPYWVGDGGITIGYGHYISQDDVKKTATEKGLYDTYAPGAIINGNCQSNGWPQKVPGSIPVPMSVVNSLFDSDVKIAEDAINDWLIKNKVIVKQNQFDALIMMRHIRGSLGSTICDDLLKEKASRSDWETKATDIGDPERKRKELDLYFNGTYSN